MGILGDAPPAVERLAPTCWVDLNLDQIVAAATEGREEYDLAPLFQRPLTTLDAIEYRHEVFRDLEHRELRACVDRFAEAMREMRTRLSQAESLHYRRQQERWFVDAIRSYVAGIRTLDADLADQRLDARGLREFRDWLSRYVASAAFAGLSNELDALERELSEITYCLQILGDQVRVTRYEAEPEYSSQVAATFERFQQGAPKDYRVKYRWFPDMDHVEAGILDLVARLYPAVFEELTGFCARHRDYVAPEVAEFDRDVQFYLGYLDLLAPLRAAGLTVSYPRVSASSKTVSASDTFDLALAHKLVASAAEVVRNDISLSGQERIIVVSGPNQGGKTTYARTFGQLHYLAALGMPVPGRRTRLFLFDRMFTHFERAETLHDLRGKLQDDLVRFREILEQATSSSLVIVNEMFSSTTVSDAVQLGSNIMRRLVELGLLAVCVSFVDELATFDQSVVSMVSTVDPADPSIRTFEIVRRAPDGLAYAIAIAEKYRLTYSALNERIAS